MSAPRVVFPSGALEPGGARPPADLIEQSERRALQELIERGSMTPREIKESVEIDQFDLPLAHAWVESALERGLIAKTGGSNASTRCNIMAAGRTAARVTTGRFAVSEKARGGEPSRRD